MGNHLNLLFILIALAFLGCNRIQEETCPVIPEEGKVMSPVAEVKVDGSLSIDGCEVCFGCKLDSKNLNTTPSYEKEDGLSRDFVIKDSGKDLFSGLCSWSQKDGRSISGTLGIVCEKDVTIDEICPRLAVSHELYPAAGWTANGETHNLGEKGYYKTLETDRISVLLNDSTSITLAFPESVNIKINDGSSKSGCWYVKFGMTTSQREYKSGDSEQVSLTLSYPRAIKLLPYEGYEVSSSEKWIPIENPKTIIKGSPLDFSNLGMRDAPAGKYGWLKAVGDHFEFEGKRGTPQRFCGANLCMSANFVSNELADSLAERLAALGYNAVRIHHQDRDLYEGENWDRMDYLISKLIEKGIYITTDLFVSRRVGYSDIGLEGKGYIDKNLYKNLVACYDPAFFNWCYHALKFLEHKNPYTGRTYRDEPAIALISLINEGKLTGCGEKNCPPIYQEWIKWGGEGTLAYNSPGFDEFEEHLTRQVFEKCSHYLISNGVKALLTNDNNGVRHFDMESAISLYDYVDNHFYIDYPSALSSRNTLPASSRDVNILKEGGPEMMRQEFVASASKPFTLTEWNYCGPNRYRGMGGLLVGSLASVNGWDGIWRFAYSHSEADVAFNPGSYPSAVNLATDPLNLASERATVCLFLRGDAENVSIDREKGTMSVTSQRTCGFFGFEGESAAGPLKANLSGAPATIWVSSLDGKALEESDSMLLVHITDVQGENTKFEDASRKLLLSWGKGTLIEKGSADVRLSVNPNGIFAVYELNASGLRMRPLKSTLKGNSLEFTVSTDGPSGGRCYYEIINVRNI